MPCTREENLSIYLCVCLSLYWYIDICILCFCVMDNVLRHNASAICSESHLVVSYCIKNDPVKYIPYYSMADIFFYKAIHLLQAKFGFLYPLFSYVQVLHFHVRFIVPCKYGSHLLETDLCNRRVILVSWRIYLCSVT